MQPQKRHNKYPDKDYNTGKADKRPNAVNNTPCKKANAKRQTNGVAQGICEYSFDTIFKLLHMIMVAYDNMVVKLVPGAYVMLLICKKALKSLLSVAKYKSAIKR